VKPLRGMITVDGERYRFLGGHNQRAAETLDIRVTPTEVHVCLEESL